MESTTVGSHWTDLFETLDRCTRRVPLFRGIEPPDATLDPAEACRLALERFPILTKDRLRGAFPHKLVPDGVRLSDALRSQQVQFVGTSGTTGERVQVLWHQPWWAAQERDGFRAHALTDSLVDDPAYREVVLTTPVCSGNLCHVGRSTMETRTVDGSILFVNQATDPALWKDDDVLRIADELEAFAPTALEADPAYLAHFAVRLRRLGRTPYRPKFIDVSYEFPSRRHVAAATAAFGDVPVLDAYGSTECGFVFMECERGRLHQNSSWSHVEVVSLDKPGLEGTGLLLVTPLRNAWLSLVRFDTGDLVRPATEPCDCGRDDGVVLEAVEGRVADLLVREDGAFVTVKTIDRALATVPGLLHYRLVQRGPRDVELDLVPTGLEPLDQTRASDAIEAVLRVAPRTRVVASVPVEASGKFRLCQATHVDAAKLARETK